MASTRLVFPICLTLSIETYWGHDWAKKLRYAWEWSSQVKFYKPSNKGRVHWLGPAKRGVDTRALVEANIEPGPADYGYEPLWVKIRNKISCCNLGAIRGVWCDLWAGALVDIDAKWKPTYWETRVSWVQDRNKISGCNPDTI